MRLKNLITLFCIAASLLAAATPTRVNIKYTIGKKTGYVKPHRVPMNLPIEVTYDSDTQYIEVACNGDVEAEVYLYDAAGNVEGYSSTLSAGFYVPEQGSYTIIIEGDGWNAEGSVEI